MKAKLAKRICAILLVLLMGIASAGWAYPADPSVVLETNPDILQLNKNDENSPVLQSAEILNNMAVSVDAYNALINSFYNGQPKNDMYKAGVYTVNGITAEGFPDAYAGAYLNENLDLVILLTEDKILSTSSLNNSAESLSQAAQSSDIIYSSAKYSYEELVSIMDTIYQYVSAPDVAEREDELFLVKYYAIDDYKNRVIVALDDISEASISAFKKTVCDSEAIIFELSEGNITDTANLLAGQGIQNEDGYTSSVGFRVRKNGVDGFVTCAHGFDPGEYVKYNNNIIGRAMANAHQNSGSIDATFVSLMYSNTASTTLAYVGGTHRAFIDTSYPQGTPVKMIGSESGPDVGALSGTVMVNTFAYDAFYDMVTATYLCDFGDSGGIVLNTRSGTNSIGGIQKALQAGQFSIFTKAANITSIFGLTPY